jgi:hypothetical protein
MNTSSKPPVIIHTLDNGTDPFGVPISLVETITGHISINTSIHQLFDDLPHIIPSQESGPAGCLLVSCSIVRPAFDRQSHEFTQPTNHGWKQEKEIELQEGQVLGVLQHQLDLQELKFQEC